MYTGEEGHEVAQTIFAAICSSDKELRLDLLKLLQKQPLKQAAVLLAGLAEGLCKRGLGVRYHDILAAARGAGRVEGVEVWVQAQVGELGITENEAAAARKLICQSIAPGPDTLPDGAMREAACGRQHSRLPAGLRSDRTQPLLRWAAGQHSQMPLPASFGPGSEHHAACSTLGSSSGPHSSQSESHAAGQQSQLPLPASSFPGAEQRAACSTAGSSSGLHISQSKPHAAGQRSQLPPASSSPGVQQQAACSTAPSGLRSDRTWPRAAGQRSQMPLPASSGPGAEQRVACSTAGSTSACRTVRPSHVQQGSTASCCLLPL
ncbi:hypothetical protein OEZ86_009512 [Tetradesmus obliquus]|uniref:MI domain-containing protein n=1 Tax=Tetradesmus obliquus TaxID=3088 RepID=A0ABY8USH9_TETOB|nr:hypothetical protein OEZ85_000959 [Tetradesmus obliquus]WIA42972.1 hypothetical protein OEZ86_009512 [Tetradesmus obliquus]